MTHLLLPRVEGELDVAYLHQALARAGVDRRFTSFEQAPLTDGRSGAVVTSLRAPGVATGLVHKAIKDDHGFRAAVAGHAGGEGDLWASRLGTRLPSPLWWPVLDAARHHERHETWLLMEDVSAGILPPGSFDAAKLDRLLAAVATLHARHWERHDRLDHLPLLGLGAVSRCFAEPISTCARGAPPRASWVGWMIDTFVVGRYLPRFLEMLGPVAADDYLHLVEHREPWLRALAGHEQTLLHNDLRRANVSWLADGRIALLDWERAARGPAAVDLTWLWFLQFWAYPPRDPHDPDAHRAAYLASLEAALGRPIDRAAFDAAWGLGWLLVMCEIGYLLADHVVENPALPAGELARRTATARRAVDEARAAAERPPLR